MYSSFLSFHNTEKVVESFPREDKSLSIPYNLYHGIDLVLSPEILRSPHQNG